MVLRVILLVPYKKYIGLLIHTFKQTAFEDLICKVIPLYLPSQDRKVDLFPFLFLCVLFKQGMFVLFLLGWVFLPVYLSAQVRNKLKKLESVVFSFNKTYDSLVCD